MTAPRLEIDLSKIRHNTRFLVDHLAVHGICVAGVTKAVCGDPAIARAMLDGGVSQLADARVLNVNRMRDAGLTCPITMIRAPMLSTVSQVIKNCQSSYNTEIEVVAALSAVALRVGKVHDIVLMVEMGDMRDGILPEDLAPVASRIADMPGVLLTGLGANFACLGSVAPESAALEHLSALAAEVEGACGLSLDLVSGGGSANLPWALGQDAKGRINELRLGEAILLGTEPVSGAPVDGLHTDAFILVAEVIEDKTKAAQASVTTRAHEVSSVRSVPGRPRKSRAIIAVGLQDTDVSDLRFPPQVTFLGATSDHAILEVAQHAVRVGDEIRCLMNYGTLMRAMNAHDVERVYLPDTSMPSEAPKRRGPLHPLSGCEPVLGSCLASGAIGETAPFNDVSPTKESDRLVRRSLALEDRLWA